MWHKKFMVGLVAVGLVLGACSSTPGTSTGPSTGASQAPASQAPAPDQVLRVNISQEPHHLDPNLASDSISIQVLRSITRPLVYFDKDLNVVPQIATSWEISPDGTTITYHLGDFKYSDGTPIVAGDFVYSYRRLSDPRVASDYSYVLEPIVGWSALQAKGADTTDADLATLGVAAPDDKTFVITLHDPSSYFLFVSAMWLGAPLKPSFVFTEAAGYVSSGPLMLSEWKHQSNIVLLPNPYWAGPAVKIGRVEMAMINDATAALAAYEADELDVSGIPRADVNRYRTDPELSQQLHEGPALSLAYFGFNMESGPTSKSLNLRKALNEVIDKDTMLATIFSNIGSVAYSVVPPGMAGYDKTVFYPYDVAKGKTDFAAALAELGTTAGALKLKLGYNVAGSNADLAAFFQAQWKDALGIDVELVPYGDFGAYLDAIGKKGTVPDIFRLGWGADYPHPQNFLFDLFDKDSGNNYSRYNSPAFEDLLLQARSTADVTQQIALYDQAQTQLMADLPLIPQSYGALFAAVKPWVQGLQQAATDTSSGSGELFYDQVSIAAH
jgi:oligopeptide transport system substrate-binding protein